MTTIPIRGVSLFVKVIGQGCSLLLMHVGPLPKGVVGYRVGNFYAASCLIKIVVTGIGIHASTPWMGKDPMPARRSSTARCQRMIP